MATKSRGRDAQARKQPENFLNDYPECGVVTMDGVGQLTQISPAARRFLGLKSRGTPQLSDLPAPVRSLLNRSLTTRRQPSGKPTTMKGWGDGAYLATLWPLNPGPKFKGCLLVLQDITAAKHSAAQVQHLQRLASIGTLAAGMAHEIKNALVAGKTFIELLLEKNQDADLAQLVRRELTRVDQIVSQMLKFGSSARAEFAEVRVHEILEHSIRLVRPQLKAKGITLTEAFEATTDVIEGNDLRLQQAIVNLLLNALEATGPQGTLTVATQDIPSVGRGRAAAGKAHLRLLITDSGSGISPEVQARLFEPFFTTKESGTGLGLLITRRIILEHGGEISVESQPNRGATFAITLPMRPGAQKTATDPGARLTPPLKAGRGPEAEAGGLSPETFRTG